MPCGEKGTFSMWSPGTAILNNAGMKIRPVRHFSTWEGLGVQIDGCSLDWECEQFRETEYKIRVLLAELNLVACIHGLTKYWVGRAPQVSSGLAFLSKITVQVAQHTVQLNFWCPTQGNTLLSWADYSNVYLFALWKKILLCLTIIFPGVTCTHYPSCFPCDAL